MGARKSLGFAKICILLRWPDDGHTRLVAGLFPGGGNKKAALQ